MTDTQRADPALIPKVGDIWRAPSGLLRVVRAAHIHSRTNYRRMFIYFAIRRCSWTKRCYTLYSVGELIGLGYVPTGRRWRIKDDLEYLVAEECNASSDDKPTLTCCDVEGMP